MFITTMAEDKRVILEPGQVLQMLETKKSGNKLKNYLKIISDAKEKLEEYSVELRNKVTYRRLDDEHVDEAFSLLAKMELLTGSRMKVYVEKLSESIKDENLTSEPSFYFRSDVFSFRFTSLMLEVKELENNFLKLMRKEASTQSLQKLLTETDEQQSPEKSLQVSEKLLQQKTEKSIEQASNTSPEEILEKSLRKDSEKSIEKLSDKKSIEKLTDKKSIEKLPDHKSIEEISKKSILRSADNSLEVTFDEIFNKNLKSQSSDTTSSSSDESSELERIPSVKQASQTVLRKMNK